MEVIKVKIIYIWNRYRYALFVLVLGIIFMLMPGKKESNDIIREENENNSVSAESETESRLQDILAQIEGVGKVEVMLTCLSGEEILYQTDGTNTSTDVGRCQTVILSRGDRSQFGLVRQVNAPVFLGAIVVCQGGGKAAVQMAVTEAVSKATGLSTNHITVLKMK